MKTAWTVEGGDISCRTNSTLDASGSVAIVAAELSLNCNIVGNDDVSVVAGSYTTSTATDLSENGSCILSGVHAAGPAPEGCSLLP